MYLFLNSLNTEGSLTGHRLGRFPGLGLVADQLDVTAKISGQWPLEYSVVLVLLELNFYLSFSGTESAATNWNCAAPPPKCFSDLKRGLTWTC